MSERYACEQKKRSCHPLVHGLCDKDHLKRVKVAFALDVTVETISYIDRLPNEILQKILTEALLFSGFSRPSQFSVLFSYITRRIIWIFNLKDKTFAD